VFIDDITLPPAVVKAYDAVVAKEAVPTRDPLNEPVLYELVKVLYDDVKVLNELVVTNDDVCALVTNELV
jgi:hypothetical protein